VVARDLAMDIKRRGGDSLFARVAPGKYTLREFAAAWLAQHAAGDVPATDSVPETVPTIGSGPAAVPPALVSGKPDITPETASH
jgi:hypothetical protein